MPELKTVKLWTARVGGIWGGFVLHLWGFPDCGAGVGLGIGELAGAPDGAFGLESVAEICSGAGRVQPAASTGKLMARRTTSRRK